MVNGVINGTYKKRLKKVLSDHFDGIKEPVSVSLGLHLRGQTIEDVVNILRRSGINAFPYYDEKVKEDLSCFVVDGTGIRSPFFKTVEDAKKATTDIFKVMDENEIETSCALPVVKDNLIKAVVHTYNGNIIDVSQNNANEKNVDQVLYDYLNYANNEMPDVAIPQEVTSKTRIYRGGFLGDKPYAIAFNRRYRDCAYGTNRLSEAVKYSRAANLGKGLQYKEIGGMSYGFVYEFKQSKDQKFYDMAGVERPFTTPEEKQTAGRPGNRPDYETLILKERNPISAIYLRVNDKLVQIADEKGYFNENGMDWGKFAKLHTPQNTSELNDYLVARMNKQIDEFPTFEYKKEPIEIYSRELNICGLTRTDKIKKTAEGIELENVNLNSLTISETINQVRLTGSLMLSNCALSTNVSALDVSNCKGDICMAHMEYINIKYPEECNSFTMSCVQMPKGGILDLSEMKCKKLTLEDVDLSKAKDVKLPSNMTELKFRYNVNLPKSIDFGGAERIVFDKTARLNYSETQQVLIADGAEIIGTDVDKRLLQSKIQNKNVEIISSKDNQQINQNKTEAQIKRSESSKTEFHKKIQERRQPQR